MDLYRYHGLGNDYLVFDPIKTDIVPTPGAIRLICQSHFGEGSDGILYGPIKDEATNISSLRIFNPDGSEAEKSGNGTRIFARYLVDSGYETERIPFDIYTKGGIVRACVHDRQQRIQVAMGSATFRSDKIPVTGPVRDIIQEELTLGSETVAITCVSIGNPHCVIIMEELSPEKAQRLGPLIEHHPMFPNRINMQLLKVLDPRNIQIEIWERGAGYTFASGSSSCAATAAAFRLGLIESEITVHMPGGQLQIAVDRDYRVEQVGPVTAVSSGIFHDEFKKMITYSKKTK